MLYGNGMGSGGWILMTLSTVALWALLIAAVVVAVRALKPQVPGAMPPGSGSTAAEDVLADRFARGDIDADEYDRRLRTLRDARH